MIQVVTSTLLGHYRVGGDAKMADLPDAVQTLLDGVYQRRLICRWGLVAMQVVVVAVLAIAAIMTVDGVWGLSSGARWAWWSLLVLSLGSWVVYRAILPWVKPRNLVDEAQYIEHLS